MKPKITKSRFIEWYFVERKDYENVGRLVATQVKLLGKAIVTPETLFESCDFIPAFITTDYSMEKDKNFSPDDCELIEG